MKDIKKIALFGLGSINWIGGIQYITNIIHALDSIHDEHPIEIHLFKSERQSFADLPKFKKSKIIVHDVDKVFPPWTLRNRAIWYVQRKYFNRFVPRLESFFVEQQFDFVFPLTASDAGGRFNAAAWIADFQYYHYPEGASKEFTDSAYNEISTIAKQSKKIILSSIACENDCVKIFPETAGKTHAVPFTVFIDEQLLAFNNFQTITEKYRIPEKFLVVSNSFCPTKNHKTLFEALGILRKEGLKIDLVCTGNIIDQRNLHFANEILQSLTTNQVRDQVHLLGIIPREDQIAVYRMATALVQPSLNEGWSTSVEEAKNLGKTLIVSDIDVHKEQCKGNPNIFERLNAADLAQKIKRIWNSSLQKQFPDLEGEKAAFSAYKNSVKLFGKRFLEVAGKNNGESK